MPSQPVTDLAWSALAATGGLSSDARAALLVVFGLLLVVLGFLFAYAIRVRRPPAPPRASPGAIDDLVYQASADAEVRSSQRWSNAGAGGPVGALSADTSASGGRGWGSGGREHSALATAVHTAQPSSLRRARLDALVCPTCRQHYERGLDHCPRDARRLVSAAEFDGDAGGAVCPVCRRGFDRGTRHCPHDGAELCPLAVYQASHQGVLLGATSGPAGVMAKICPKCRRRHDLAAIFCGRDGTELVAIH